MKIDNKSEFPIHYVEELVKRIEAQLRQIKMNNSQEEEQLIRISMNNRLAKEKFFIFLEELKEVISKYRIEMEKEMIEEEEDESERKKTNLGWHYKFFYMYNDEKRLEQDVMDESTGTLIKEFITFLEKKPER